MGMDVYAFKSIVKQEYPNYEVFENEAKNAVIRQKLISSLVLWAISNCKWWRYATILWKNINKYLTSKYFDVVQYSSTNRNALVDTIQNPSKVASGEVTKVPLKLESNKIHAQLQYILNGTKPNTFTPIFTADKQYVTLFLKQAEGKLQFLLKLQNLECLMILWSKESRHFERSFWKIKVKRLHVR